MKDPDKNNYAWLEKIGKSILIKYIEKHKTLDGMKSNIEGKKIYDRIYKQNFKLYDIVEELGYTLDNLLTFKPRGYYNIEKIKEKINGFINIHDRFPTTDEITKVLNIDIKIIYRNFKNINDIKKLINYTDKYDLTDLRGDSNRSLGELFLANYLILNGFKDSYKREQCPFSKEDGLYRSDFTLYPKGLNKELHIEVWGYKDRETSKIAKNYNKVRKVKEKLYNKYKDNMILIGIEYNTFNNNYDKIQEKLYNILKNYLTYEFKIIKYNLLIFPVKYSDDELYSEIMKYSDDGITLPYAKKINGTLYNEVLKRFKSYNKFAEKYHTNMHSNMIEWSRVLIFDKFEDIMLKGASIRKKSITNGGYKLQGAVDRNGGLINLKLDFFSQYSGKLPKLEIKWLLNVANRNKNISETINEEEIINAKVILDKLYPNYNENHYCNLCGKSFKAKHIHNLYCNDCSIRIDNNEISEQTRKVGCKYNERDYEENFYNTILNGELYKLTITGFNENTNIKTYGYKVYFNNATWIDILKKYDKYNDLYGYIINQYKDFIKKTKKPSLNKFCQQHEYITYNLVKSIGFDNIYKHIKEENMLITKAS